MHIRSFILSSLALGTLAGALHSPEGGDSVIELDQNLDAFEDYEILPKSTYPATCTLAEIRMSDAGNEYYYTNWTIDVSDYPADYDVENAPEGTVLNYSRVQVPSAADRRSITNVKKLMRAIGVDLKTKTIDCSQWVGQKANLVVGHNKYNGETRNQILSIESLDA